MSFLANLDELWLDTSKSRLQDTVDLAHAFFTLWDIKINIKKCELLIINPSVSNDQRFISMGDITEPSNIIRATPKEIRYLGVWFTSSRNAKRLSIKRLKVIRDTFLRIVKHKQLSIVQTIYIINKAYISIYNKFNSLICEILDYKI